MKDQFVSIIELWSMKIIPLILEKAFSSERYHVFLQREREREKSSSYDIYIYQLQSSVTWLFAATETNEISAVAWYSGRLIRYPRW